MLFQDTRLYELCRWIFAGLLGLALAFRWSSVILPWGIEPLTFLGRHEYIGFSVLILFASILIFLSMWFALPMISLILAMWGVLMLAFGLSFQLMPDSVIIRLGIYLLLAITSGALWYYYCRKKAEKNRFIFVQVIATGALAWALFLCVEAEEKGLFALRQSKIVDELATIVHQELVYLVLISLYVLLASLISCPLFIQFGLILAAAFSVLRYGALGPQRVYSTISNIYIAFLVLFLCFRLYRQQRSCP